MKSLRVSCVTKTSGHLLIRKNYNAPHPPGKSWSTIDRALQNGFPAVWSKAYSEDEDFFIRNKKAENSSFGFSDGKRLYTEIRRGTQFAPDLIGTELLVASGDELRRANARNIISFCFCGEYN